jgi:hypothetical protein
MKQVKRWAALAVSVTALAALMVPSVASAARLEQPKGTLVPKGTEVILTSNNFIQSGANGVTIRCGKVELKGVLTRNNGKEVTIGNTTSVIAAENCAALGPVAETFSLTELTSTGGGPGTLTFLNTWKGLCEETGSLSVTWNGTSKVHVKGAQNGGCGVAADSGDFTVTDNSAQELIFTN